MSTERLRLIAFQELTIEEAKQDYPILWETARETFPKLSARGIAKIVSLVVDVCPYCHIATRDCQCWNDE